MKLRKSTLAVLSVAALAVPAAAVAHPGHGHANGHNKSHSGHANGHNKSHNVQYVFKGTYDGTGLVNVTAGNHHARAAGLVGVGDVQFDLTNTKLDVADTNADLVIDVNDVVTGDQVLVQARLPRQDPGSQPFAARHLVDQTSPADSDSSDTSDSTDTESDGS
jgi:hypothetical protein